LRTSSGRSSSNKKPYLPLILAVIILATITPTLSVEAGVPNQVSLAVVCMEFPDTPHRINVETIRTNAIDKVAAFYKEMSYGKLVVTGDVFGWYMMPLPLSKFDECNWTSPWEEVHRLTDLALLTAKPMLPQSYSFFFFVFSGDVWGYALPDEAVAALNERDTWNAFAHEVGHLLGLPDLYSYEARAKDEFGGVFVGSWDIMSDSSYGTSVSAYDRIKLGWISENQTFKAKWNSWNSSATISPIETGQGILAFMVETRIEKNYYLVEVRQGRGVLITCIDETKRPGRGIVTAMDAHPNSTTYIWEELSDALFNLWEGENPVYIDSDQGFAIILLARTGPAYTVSIATPNLGRKALEAHYSILSANASVQKSWRELRVEGLEQARTALRSSIAAYQEARFGDSIKLAETAKALADKAVIPETYYDAKTDLEKTEERLMEIWSKRLESVEAVAKCNEAAAELHKAKRLFEELQFESTLQHLKRCNELMSGSERLERSSQDMNRIMLIGTGAIGSVVIASGLMLRRKREHAPSQHV